ncbi:glycosyltransferase family 4 protein [Flexivirga alba]|uniref:D-inositol 3-phosphate glycosyltransferase n=1 Tax=Flexivirga alba TaxID=702742 RepID=A0ABW2AFZ0_9MICO
MKIGLITQWYDPEPGPAALPGALARGLLARGHEVQVLTAFPNYPSGVISPEYAGRLVMNEVLDGVHVRRTAVYPDHSASSVRRLQSYTSFGASASLLGTDALRGCDALWVNYSPITVAWPMWLARFGLRIPAVLHVLDLWPDTLVHSGFAERGRLGEAVRVACDVWCRAMYRSAHSVAYIAPTVGRVLEGRGVDPAKLSYVPMWADEAVFRPSGDGYRSELGLSSEDIVVVYAGAMGEAQDVGSLIDAAVSIDDPRLKVVLAGSGAEERVLRSKADAAPRGNVRFLGRIPQAQMTALLGAADVSYVSLRRHPLSAITMPSKTQAGLAAAKPLLVAADGDARAVVTAQNVGFGASPEVESIANALRAIVSTGRGGLAAMGSRARRLYEDEFSVSAGVTRIEALLAAAATGGARQ